MTTEYSKIATDSGNNQKTIRLPVEKAKNGFQTLLHPHKENFKREVMRKAWSDKLIKDLFYNSAKENLQAELFNDDRSDKP